MYLYWVGAVLTLSAVILFTLLDPGVNISHSQKRLTDYFINHPTRFEIIFQLMLLAFPVAFGVMLLDYMGTESQYSALSIIILFIFSWPILMYSAHQTLIEFEIELGFSSRKRKEIDPILIAKLKIIGWIISLGVVIVSLIVAQFENLSFLASPLAMLGFIGICFIPIRKSLDIIRNKGEIEEGNDRRSKVLILDLDGVIRHLDMDTAERAAQSIGFTYNELMQTLWYNEYSQELLCGRSTRKEWWDHVHKFDPRLEGVPQDVLWDQVFEISTYDTELTEYVRGLKDKFILVILTNCDKESKIQILEELGNNHPFDFVFSSSDFGVAKPDRAIFRKMVNKIEAEGEQCIFFDDAIANVEAAQECGIHAFHYEGIDHLRSVLEDRNQ